MAPSWFEVRAQLAKVVQVHRQDERGFVGVTSDGREIHLQRTGGDTTEWLLIRTPICPERDMDPTLTLERNATLGFTVLLLERGVYWLRISVPLDSGEIARPERLVRLLTAAADSLRPHFEAAAAESPSLAIYRD